MRDPASIRPFRSAALVAGLYLVVCGIYIPLSGRIAARSARTIDDLQRVEQVKGLVFVAVTGLAIFAAAYWVLLRIAHQQRRIFQQQQALAASESRAMAGIFAASVAHDMNNLLQLAHGNVELLELDAPRMRGSHPAAAVKRSLDELSALSTRLLALGRSGTAERRETADLVALIQETVAVTRSHIGLRGRRLTAHIEDAVAAPVNRSLVARSLVNLILNAAEATLTDGRIEVRLRNDAGWAVLEVHDDGPGVPPQLRPKVFEVFYSTKQGGTGLGLLPVKVCADEHHGAVELVESDLGGACFRLRLPLQI
jgi:two-component system sensor histidine kinase HydH